MNSTIKTKLAGGFGILLILLIAAVLLVMNTLSETNNRLAHLVSVSAERKALSNKMLVGVLQVTRYEKNIILVDDVIRKNRCREKIDENNDLIAQKMGDLRKILDNEEDIKKLDMASTIWTEYQTSLQQIINMAYLNETDEALKISVNEGLRARDRVISLLEQIIESAESSMTREVDMSNADYEFSLQWIIAIVIISVLIAILVSYWIIRNITGRIASITAEGEKIASREFSNEVLEDKISDELTPLIHSLSSIATSFRDVTESANRVASGDYEIDIQPKSERDTLGIALKKMARSLLETTAENQRHNWLTLGQNQLNEQLRGDHSIQQLAGNIISFLCTYLQAHVGTTYILQGRTLLLSGTYAIPTDHNPPEKFNLGEGLVGQVALEQKPMLLEDAREDHVQITSSLVQSTPKNLLISPFSLEGQPVGTIEIGRLTPFTNTELDFVSSAMESIAISITSAIARKRIQELLEETQKQSEELQTQQEELRQMNEELEEQAQSLKQQQEELQITNEELEEQTHALELKNKQLEYARIDIEQKSRQLEISSRYKSEFLANMSHELRTPLNSLLILSKDLSDNKLKNLSRDQVESAEIIYKSGHDLLILINEVLDLSKIEAGKMSVNVEKVRLREFVDTLHRNFKRQIEQKKLTLALDYADDLPEFIRTDAQRLEQILKNLMSNAIKFTHEGSVKISVRKQAGDYIELAVTDTGIGIPEDKQMTVFEAFQQADGGTARKYGGTGLGLSISRELARLLGGRISLVSKPGQGSTFTLSIPYELPEDQIVEPVRKETPKSVTVINSGKFLGYPTIDDDREQVQEEDKVVLIIEDDLKFADILLKQAHAKKFKCIAAATGEDGLVLAMQYKPQAIILDLDLPGMSGFEVLAELKSTPALRHIPVHIMSVNERTLEPIKDGAVEYITKPVDKKELEEAFNRIENFISRKIKNLLVIEDDANSRIAIRKLIGNGDVKTFEAETGEEALQIIHESRIDCIVLDIGLPDMTGFDFIYKLEKLPGVHIPPIIIYTGKDLSREENEELQKHTETIIIKGVKSEDRLLDETALFLHRTISDLPVSKQRMITELYDKESIFTKKKVLLVDDDMRNVFALSKVLKERGMEVTKAENGLKALEALDKEPDINLVLMDIMMPEMDGYEAMRRIRAQQRFRHLPMIALTAKAMKDDKQKCIDAGANDYITKPVDLERLLSLLRVWLSK
jgi:signal transduction histidine kinase/CheY-like chemotaxis protein/methyl-accepting chemotaxis protein